MKDEASISYNKLRQAIGLLGLALPLFLYLHTRLFGCCCLQDSISHYYYTKANVWFIGILWGLGLVLIFYPTPASNKGRDGLLTSLSGICSICVSLFPTNANSNDCCAIFHYCDSPWRAGFHYFCAATMLLIFSYMSIKLFTKTDKADLSGDEHRWKRRRNFIFRTCGWITFLSVVAIGVITVLEALRLICITSKYTYWLEVSALVPFGIAWLIKGGFLLVDDNDTSTMEQLKNMVTRKNTSIVKQNEKL